MVYSIRVKQLNNKKIEGAGFILMSAFFFATYGIWSRLMSSSFGVFSQSWTRGLALLVVTLILNIFFKFIKPINKKDWIWFLIIGATALNQAPIFFGFKYLDIGTATLLFYSALVIGGYLVGKFVFKEKLTKWKLFSLLLAFLGMLIIYGLVITPDQFLAAGLMILGGLMGACGSILPKKLSQNYSGMQILISYYVAMTVVDFILAKLMNNPLPRLELNVGWLAQIGYTFSFLIANLLVIKGYKHLEPSIGSLIGLAEIIFGVVFGAVFFGEIVGWGVVIGSILILISAVLPNIKIKDNLFK